MTKPWNVESARAQYAVGHWGEGYFDIDDRGWIVGEGHRTGGPFRGTGFVLAPK